MTSRAALAIALAACGPGAAGSRAPATAPTAARPRIAIVASEQSSMGARLVAIDETGDRQLELIEPAQTTVRDVNPVVSPDGAWLVFASSRGRSLDATSVWIAPLGLTAVPRRLTDGTGIDSHPTWTRDGKAIVFASTRGTTKTLDLWRIDLAFPPGGGPPVARGAPAQLTSDPGYEITPSVAADGTIVYAEVTASPGGAATSVIMARAPDGTTHALTTGPADTSPALSPDGTTIAFSRAVPHGTSIDAQLFRMPVTGGEPIQLLDGLVPDAGGPVWSRDGRFVFATSRLLSAEADRHVLFSSVIHVDTREHPMVARILEDRAGATWRLTPALTGVALDAATLHADPEYVPELKRIVGAAMTAPDEP